MFDILIYFFEIYVHSKSAFTVDYDSLEDDLSNIGFRQKDICHALRWLKNLSCYKKNITSCIKPLSNQNSIRIYTIQESMKFNADCQGFILFLEQLDILTLDIREMIIEQIMDLDINEIHLEDLKWLVLIVLFTVPGCELFYKKLENLLFNVHEEIIH